MPVKPIEGVSRAPPSSCTLRNRRRGWLASFMLLLYCLLKRESD